MQTSEKRTLKQLVKIPRFSECITKFTCGDVLSEDQLTYLLHCAIIFLMNYESDKRFKSFADFSYYIILKYSLKYNDYQPLYDFALNFGYYPIVKSILSNKLLDKFSIQGICDDIELDRYKNETYIETLHQFVEKKSLLNNSAAEISYIAPTSYGKSSVIVECIKSYASDESKILIIVPTKSLLMQTYRMIREADLKRKIIIHDEMFQGEKTFIAVFTQERALRLLNKTSLSFNLIFLDEAHNIMKSDFRSILISRTLRLNKSRNPQQKVIYLSPLIDDIQNIKFEAGQMIEQHKVEFNIKEPEIYEYRLDHSIHQYNRFIGEFYKLGTSISKFSYLISASGERNFIYANSPRKIERLSKELSSFIGAREPSSQITELIRILKQEVHERFYMVQYVTSGIVYLHGKLPDLIKEYLESKYRELPELKYLIANSVVLEGMNLPIDTLFIFNALGLEGKELTNLIGRVNRLNTIFNDNQNNLYKLLPKVHFVNSEDYNRSQSNMANKIILLRSNTFKDTVKNPTLEAFDVSTVTKDRTTAEATIEKISITKANETFLTSIPSSDFDRMKIYLIQTGITEFYRNVDQIASILFERINIIKSSNYTEWNSLGMLDKIFRLFVNNLEDERLVKDLEFKRISFVETRKHYEAYITISQRKSLHENVNDLVTYFKSRIEKKNVMFYFGESYGEEVFVSDEYKGTKRVYVDLSTKTNDELVNLAIVKLKLEDDFISFKLNKFIVMMYDFEIISADEYHEYIYGTKDSKKIALSKIGLNVSLITRLERDQQIGNLNIDEYNNLRSTPAFDEFKMKINDFYRFEIERFIN